VEVRVPLPRPFRPVLVRPSGLPVQPCRWRRLGLVRRPIGLRACPGQAPTPSIRPTGVSAVRAGAADTHAGHGHGNSTVSAWLLLLPVLAVFLVAPPALGADSVSRSAGTNRSVAAEDGSAVFPPLPAGDVIALPLSDFSARAAWDKGNSLNDRPVRLTGFIVHDAGATYVARLAIGCCAADAFPVKIKLAGAPDLAALPNDTWVEVVATLQPGTATRDSDFVPTATVNDAREIPQPEDPYEH
jgi:uncharacterized repeat protein (TIGR03943 family)